MHQIWVATRFNGYHFDLQGDTWIDNRFGHRAQGAAEPILHRPGGRRCDVPMIDLHPQGARHAVV